MTLTQAIKKFRDDTIIWLESAIEHRLNGYKKFNSIKEGSVAEYLATTTDAAKYIMDTYGNCEVREIRHFESDEQGDVFILTID